MRYLRVQLGRFPVLVNDYRKVLLSFLFKFVSLTSDVRKFSRRGEAFGFLPEKGV